MAIMAAASDRSSGRDSSATWKLILNFASIYVIWGSTYIAIKYAVGEIPPFFLSGSRFVTAALILLGFARVRRERWITGRAALLAGISGSLLVLGNSLVCVSEQWLPSGTVAVMIGTVPVWILVLNAAFFGGGRPSLRQAAGVALALTGIFFLTRSQGAAAADPHASLGLGILSFSVIGWSLGTLIQRKAEARGSFFTFTGVQLLLGGLAMLTVSLVAEGPARVAAAHVTSTGWIAAAYLVVFGSVVAYSSYVWLSQRVEPAQVSTYALVNPLIAVWLGWFLGGESFSTTMIAMSGLILVGLYLVVFAKKRA